MRRALKLMSQGAESSIPLGVWNMDAFRSRQVVDWKDHPGWPQYDGRATHYDHVVILNITSHETKRRQFPGVHNDRCRRKVYSCTWYEHWQELILISRQTCDFSGKPYFLLGLRLYSQPQRNHPLATSKLYCLMTSACMQRDSVTVEQLSVESMSFYHEFSPMFYR